MLLDCPRLKRRLIVKTRLLIAVSLLLRKQVAFFELGASAPAAKKV
jgi:hypothetical protein